MGSCASGEAPAASPVCVGRTEQLQRQASEPQLTLELSLASGAPGRSAEVRASELVLSLKRRLADELVEWQERDARRRLADEVVQAMPLEFAGAELENDWSWQQTGVCDGAQLVLDDLQLQADYEDWWVATATVPHEGLCLWLDARTGVELDPHRLVMNLDVGNRVTRWSNPLGAELDALPELVPDRGIRPPELVHTEFGPGVRFGYDATGLIWPALPDGVRTVCSVHEFKRDRAHPCQFYIITGEAQGAFHGGETEISTGHGVWAGGDAFYNGTIRVDCQPAVPVRACPVARFTDGPSCAVVQCEEPGCVNRRGPGMNRIGRDRNCHAFTGIVHELLVYDRRLSEEEVQRIERHFQANWPAIEVFAD